MKNRRKSTRALATLLTIIMTLGLLPMSALSSGSPEVIWPSFRGNARNMAVVDATTARTPEEAELKWATQIVSTGFMGPFPNTPVIVGEHLILSHGANIYKVDKNTGQVVADGPMVSAAAFNISSITYGGGMVFAPVSNGRIQAFNADTLVSLWVSEPMGGQSNSYITYHDGYVYSGFWTGSSGENYYVCIDVKDDDPSQTTEVKEVTWKHGTPAGYYWVNGIVMGDYILFGSENGFGSGTSGTDDPSQIFALDRLTGELSDTLEGLVGDQRSGISYDEETGRLFFTTRSGYVCSVKFDETTGEFVEDTFVSKQVVAGWQATGTPVVYDGVLFIGVGGGPGGGGRLVAADAETLEEIDQVALLGYSQSSPLLSTAYYQDTGKLYIYVTYNNNPGGLTVVEYDSTTKTLAKEELFTPSASMQQYTLDSAVCDADGTIYYRNDSGYIFAIGRNTAYLDSLAADVGSFDKVFSSGVSDYELVVPRETENVELTFTAPPGMTTKVDGISNTSGSANITLADESATVAIEVTNGSDSRTYTVSIRWAGNTTGLNVVVTTTNNDPGAAAFAHFTDNSYSHTLADNSTNNFRRVWLKPEDSNATWVATVVSGVSTSAAGNPVAAGTTLNKTPTGSHTRVNAYLQTDGIYANAVIKVTVTAEDGITKEDYFVTLTRTGGTTYSYMPANVRIEDIDSYLFYGNVSVPIKDSMTVYDVLAHLD